MQFDFVLQDKGTEQKYCCVKGQKKKPKKQNKEKANKTKMNNKTPHDFRGQREQSQRPTLPHLELGLSSSIMMRTAVTGGKFGAFVINH